MRFPNGKNLAGQKAASKPLCLADKASVTRLTINYFTWRTPVRDGKMRSFHTLEIPFVFENGDLAKSMTGSGEDRYALSDKISGAWVAFARTGNPNHRGLPNWPAFNHTQRATMILNDDCRVVNDPNGEERLTLRGIQAPN